MRFCMITTFYPPFSFGGDAVFVQRLSQELACRGHHVEVIHCVDAYRTLAGGAPAATREDAAGVVVHGLRSPFGLLSPLATQQTGFPLFKSARIRSILDRGFDVIHFHNVSLVGGPGVLRYGRALKLYTMHEHWLICAAHILFRYNREVCGRRSCCVCQITHRRPPQLWRYTGLLNAMTACVDAFIAPSRFVKAQHELRRGREIARAARIVTLPYFVPPAVPPSMPSCGEGPRSLNPYFLYVGRLEKLKGVQTLIPIFQRHARARLLIAGRGSLEARLRQLTKTNPNIHVLGHQTLSQVRELMRGAVALLVPSICYEVFPTVTLEAFSVGTPAIVRDIGGLPEQIEQCQGGFVYRTSDELIAAIDELLADSALRDDLGGRAYRAYTEHWTPAMHVERYMELIRGLSVQRCLSEGTSDGGAARP